MWAWLTGGMVNNHEWYMRPTDPADAAKQATQKATQEEGRKVLGSIPGKVQYLWIVLLSKYFARYTCTILNHR